MTFGLKSKPSINFNLFWWIGIEHFQRWRCWEFCHWLFEMAIIISRHSNQTDNTDRQHIDAIAAWTSFKLWDQFSIRKFLGNPFELANWCTKWAQLWWMHLDCGWFGRRWYARNEIDLSEYISMCDCKATWLCSSSNGNRSFARTGHIVWRK